MYRIEAEIRQASTPVPGELRSRLEKDLHAYVMAACAAGVSILACASTASAKIVYTPANRFIFTSARLDLDHNGKADFVFSNTFTSYNRNGQGHLKITPKASPNAIWGTGTSASALAEGVRVGANKHLGPGHTLMARMGRDCTSVCTFGSAGPWVDVTRRYLGLKFTINGKVHYGWARLNVTVNMNGIGAILTGYAYETVPGKSIVTGQTKSAPVNRGGTQETPTASDRNVPAASLGLLAQGAGGLDIWRRPRASAN